VTDNETSYKVVGQMLMAKRKRLFWKPCVAKFVDLMLEDYDKVTIHEETIPKGKKNCYVYLFKNLSNFSTTTFHKRKRFGKTKYYSLCYILLEIGVTS